MLSQAQNISYHSVQNFPGVGFGYLELPMAEATKLKKKLNGSILKGHKIRIEDAQPEKRKRPSEDDDGEAEDEQQRKKKTRKSKTVKTGDKVLQGYELEDGRKVKRGWTETPTEKRQEKEARKKAKKTEVPDRAATKKEKKAKREASKYTNEPECLFRTTLPPGAEPTEDVDDKKSKKAKKKSSRDAVVHEFSNTKKHASFLKTAAPSSSEKSAREYVEGKGWVDGDGNVLEPETTAQREKRERKERRRAEKAGIAVALQEQTRASADDGASSKRKSKAKEKILPTKEPTPSESEPSSSEPSSPEPSSDEDSSASETDQQVVDQVDQTPKAVHPLEALYKRPLLSPLDTTPKMKKDNAFSFFGTGEDSDIEMDGNTAANTEPQTPFNEQDLEWRTTRSAAPTPDTAAIGKRFSFSVMDDIDEDDDDDADGNGATTSSNTMLNGLGISGDSPAESLAQREPAQNSQEKEESDFAKWFFENRGENNKKWRLRRREAMKLKRKRENRRLTRRIV